MLARLFLTGKSGWVGLALLVTTSLPGRAGGQEVLSAPPSNGLTSGTTNQVVSLPPLLDPTDQPFRVAPMNESARSVAIRLSADLHVAFDTQRLRMHTAWSGPGLNLFGTPHRGAKTPFICTVEGKVLWTTPQEFPWSDQGPVLDGPRDPPPGSRFLGITTTGNRVTLHYEIMLADGAVVRISEAARHARLGEFDVVVREFTVAGAPHDLFLLALAGMGVPADGDGDETPTNVRLIRRQDDFLVVAGDGSRVVRVETLGRTADSWREVITEAGTEEGFVREPVRGPEVRVLVRIPARRTPASFAIATAVGESREEALRLASALGSVSDWCRKTVSEADRTVGGAISVPPHRPAGAVKPAEYGDASYRIEQLPLPAGIRLMVTGMDFLADGSLAVSTWTGEIWIVENVVGDPAQMRYRRFARGLNEPLGLKAVGQVIYVAQKGELTRIIDSDGDGEADQFDCVNAGWGYTGNYHAFAFGPMVDGAGNYYVALCGQRGRWDVPYLGWTVKISPDGRTLESFCSGLRAPNGFGTFGPEGDLFVTDNEGNWVGACKLNHVRPGRYYGHPSAWPASKEDWGQKRQFTPPAVWFPRRLAPSAGGFVEIRDGQFGPFQGQMLVGDFQNSHVMRVMLERVHGEWQGAVWPFARGFSSGVNRLVFGPDGRLYVGGLKNKAWPASGPRESGLDRVTFTGIASFEMREIKARSDGFDLIFTDPVDRGLAADPESYHVAQFTYAHHASYGSPEFDHDGRPHSATTIEVKRVTLSPDARTVTLILDGLREGHVTQVRCLDLRNERGEPLRHDLLYYTLNTIPRQLESGDGESGAR